MYTAYTYTATTTAEELKSFEELSSMGGAPALYIGNIAWSLYIGNRHSIVVLFIICV